MAPWSVRVSTEFLPLASTSSPRSPGIQRSCVSSTVSVWADRSIQLTVGIYTKTKLGRCKGDGQAARTCAFVAKSVRLPSIRIVLVYSLSSRLRSSIICSNWS